MVDQQSKGWDLWDRISCITLKGRWCDIIVLNVHGPSEDKDDYIKDSFYIERLFDQLPVYHMKILLGEYFSANIRERKGTSRR